MHLVSPTGKEIAEEFVLALKLDDVIRQEPRDPIGSPLRPPRFHIAKIVTQRSLQGLRKFGSERVEEFSEVRLQPVYCPILPTKKEQEQVCSRCRVASLQYAESLAQCRRTIGLEDAS